MDYKERILSNEYIDYVMDFTPEVILQEGNDVCYIPLGETYYAVYSKRALENSQKDRPFGYRYIPKVYGLMQQETEGSREPGEDLEQQREEVTESAAGEQGRAEGQASGRSFDPSALYASGILQMQRAPLYLTGRGTVICIIDTGIDYAQPAFLDAFGNSRILAIWDQTIQDGPAPEGFYFGTEYKRKELNEALQEADPFRIVPSRDENGHGTIMAGLCAASSLDGINAYTGAAPESELVIVKLKECKPYLRDYYFIPENVPAYEETDIMLAVKYADTFAETFRRPVIICIGVGTNTGDHDGNSFLAGFLNAVAVRRSRVVTVGGGSEGNAAHHFFGQFPLGNAALNAYRDVEVRVGEDISGFQMEFWGSIPDIYRVAVRSPGGETIPPFRVGVENNIVQRFIYERTVITIRSILVEANSGEELIIFRIQDPTPGIWNFRILPAGVIHNGSFHMWLPISQFVGEEVYFLEPNPYTTLTEPSMALDIISVSSYNDANNSFYIESGRGYSRMGAIRPDFAAPGVNVDTLYGRRSGSSLSAALTAGAAAQFMQWAVVQGNSPLAESKEVRNYFIQGASRTPEQSYPNRELGYGRLNLAGTFEVLAGV